MNKFTPAKRTTTEEEMKDRLIRGGMEEEKATFLASECMKDEVFLNDTYQVNVRRDAKNGFTDGKMLMVHLSIKRRDKRAIRDWRHFQQIKNELVGPECEAIELFPAESRLVDGANQYHLWCLAEAGMMFPVGFMERGVYDEGEAPVEGCTQRAFGEALPEDNILTFGPEDIKRLKKAYNHAVDNGLDLFYFESSHGGGDLLVSYAKYLIEYLEMKEKHHGK